jgi:hypothetical protein
MQCPLEHEEPRAAEHVVALREVELCRGDVEGSISGKRCGLHLDIALVAFKDPSDAVGQIMAGARPKVATPLTIVATATLATRWTVGV